MSERNVVLSNEISSALGLPVLDEDLATSMLSWGTSKGVPQMAGAYTSARPTYEEEIADAAKVLDELEYNTISILGPEGSRGSLVGGEIAYARPNGRGSSQQTLRGSGIMAQVVARVLQRRSPYAGLIPLATTLGGSERCGTRSTTLGVLQTAISRGALQAYGLIHAPIEHIVYGLDSIDPAQLRGRTVYSDGQALEECQGYISDKRLRAKSWAEEADCANVGDIAAEAALALIDGRMHPEALVITGLGVRRAGGEGSWRLKIMANDVGDRSGDIAIMALVGTRQL